MHLAAPLLAVLLQAPPDGLLVARLQLDLPAPAAAPGPAPDPAPDLAPPAPAQRPALVRVDRGAPPGAVLAASGMVLVSDLVFSLVAIQGFVNAWNHDGGGSGGALFLFGAAGLLFVTPFAAVAGAGWAGVEGDAWRAYWATFGVRLAALAVVGMVARANDGGPARQILGGVYLATEFWLQPWVATRVLGATGVAPAPVAASPAAAARPVADPALAR